MNNPVKKMNTLYLSMVAIYLLISFAASLLVTRGFELNTMVLLIVGELVILLPGTAFLLLFRCDFREWFPMRRIKVSTIFFTILIAFLVMPFLYLLNLGSQLFTDNMVVDMMLEMGDMPNSILFLIVGIIGPICEELAFRGILFHGFKRSGRILGAAIYTAVLFGLFHMNFNQFGYACAVGFVSAMLLEATGSLISSMIFHIVINSYNVLQIIVMDLAYGMLGENSALLEEAASELDANMLLTYCGYLLIPAVGGVALAIVAYISVCNREGTREHIMEILPHREQIRPRRYDEPEVTEYKKPRLLSVTGAVGIVLCIAMMVTALFEII